MGEAVKALHIPFSTMFSADFNNFIAVKRFINCPYIGCPKKMLFLLMVLSMLILGERPELLFFIALVIMFAGTFIASKKM